MPHAFGVWVPGLQVEALGVELGHLDVGQDRVSPSPPAWVGWSCFGVLFAVPALLKWLSVV